MSGRTRQAMVAALAAWTLTTAVRAEVIHVPRDQPTLRAAIKSAEDKDKIVLADGVWTEHGNLNLTLDNKQLTIRSLNGPERCIIDGDGTSAFLEVFDYRTEGTVIEGFTFRNLAAPGVHGELTSVTLLNCVFEKCRGPNLRLDHARATVRDSSFLGGTQPRQHFAAGIGAEESELDVVSCRFENNAGQGISASGRRIAVVDSVFKGNVVPAETGALGVVYEQILIRGCEFIENTGGVGAGAKLLSRSSGEVTVEDCRFVSNRTPGEPTYDSAALVVSAGHTVLADSHFIGNSGYGAKVTSDIVARDCTFDSQSLGGLRAAGGDVASISSITATKNGGHGLILSSFDSARVADSVFRGNGNVEQDGGGIWASGRPVIERCLMEDNVARGGGGAYGEVILRDCTLRGNMAAQNGGAVLGNKVRIINSLLVGNRAGVYGGGASGRRLETSGSVFLANVAGASGGAIHATYDRSDCVNCVLYGNVAESGSGGGLYLDGARGEIYNNILWANEAPQGPQIGVEYGLLSGAFNTAEGGRKAIWGRFGRQSILSWNHSNLDADPMFVDPDAGDFRLQSGSPCIDASDNRAVPEFVAADPDRHLRFHDDPNTPDTGRGRGAIADMGAYEFDAPASCIGGERLRAKCVPIDDGFAIEAILRDARPDARLTLESDTNPAEPQVVQLNRRGRAKASFQTDDPQSVRVRVIECDLVTQATCR